MPPGGDQQWRLAGACLAPGVGGLLRLALYFCRRALPVDIFALLLAIPGHSFIWTFGAKLPIYKKDTKKMGISGIFGSMQLTMYLFTKVR